MSKSANELLSPILMECHYINSVITPDITKNKFLENETFKRAIARSLKIIGEATKKIPVDIKLKLNNIS